MLFGRDDELAELTRLLSEDRAVVVSGEAGVGKTTLLREVAASSRRAVFEGGALATLSWMQYLPLHRALRRHVVEGDPTAVAKDVEAAVGSGVMLIDDAQWADRSTLEVLTVLAGRIGALAGVRRGDPGADLALDRMRAAGFVEIALNPLDATSAEAVVRELRPDLGPEPVARLLARTGGNPLLLHELSLSGEPSPSLRLALAARLRQLDPAGREAFGMLALAGRPVSREGLGESATASLLAAELAVAVPSGIEIRHVLLAEVAAGDMDAEQKKTLHARIARSADDDGEAARHHALAGEAELAYAAALRAAEATTLPAEQASHLAVAAASASGLEADALWLRAARALEQAHQWDAMIGTLDLISPGNAEAQAWSYLLRARGAWTAGDSVGLRDALDAGLALVAGTDSAIEVELRIEHSRVPIFIDADLAEGVRSTSAALQLAQTTGVDVPRALYLHGTALAIADRSGAEEMLLAAIGEARAAGDTSTELLAGNNLISFHESGGDPTVARRLCVEFVDRAHELGLGQWEHILRAELVALDFHAGEYRRVFSAAEELLTQPLETQAYDQVLGAFCIALIDVGRIDEARRRVDSARITSDYRGEMQVLWVRVEAALWGGDAARALTLAERYLEGPDGDPNTMLGVISRAWAMFDLDRDPGPPPPPQVRAMLRAIAPEAEGVRRLQRGEADAAAAFDEAAALWAPYHRRGELRCLWASGEAMRRAGDATQAIQRLEAVEARALADGLAPLVGRIQRSLRAAGQRRSAPRTRSPGSTLTAGQRQVLALVSEGLTNTEIALRLGISRHKVVAQLTSAAAKLGASNRAQAATLAETQIVG